eukprot:CAMPEP_0182886742 /NCGR_PEP_ID=MMETSP0034_2-20130328/20405_1 /TAXON_ID=156128 /ORGANISM="Nephroselmis pyriformis, Strain CCMP717" /LENGTH=289 /DNA_ID=CAMNT_0025020081 /DNA_START=34 /DNA_END=900 /DNA_ORIENTATION=+
MARPHTEEQAARELGAMTKREIFGVLLQLACIVYLAFFSGEARDPRAEGRERARQEAAHDRKASGMSQREADVMAGKVRGMFYHAYDNYMQYAFPGDELKPMSRAPTNSLQETGNLDGRHLNRQYKGVAMTLIDSLSTLAILEDRVEFEKAVRWLANDLRSFNVDVRVNVFETNIRILGSLISAHLLASDPATGIMPHYAGELLPLAADMGNRLLPAFNSPTRIPYAWVNLKHGVMKGDTTETNTAGCGSLILEFGLLSRITGDPKYESAAKATLRKLWSMRSKHNLLG